MTNPYRSLCAELLDEVVARPLILDRELIDRARALLDEPEAVGPSASDVTELFYRHMGEGSEVGFENAVAEALSRWGRPAAAPVPVSERLPGPDDCDAEGRCWWGEPQIEDSHDATWNLCTQDDAKEFCTWGTKCGWLPANALPTPRHQ